ncbi:importin-5 [Artemisia annua]|uniref:Importin-5 n=1 Tax=Artemisia annua TaxID=35608 RepID=A0A2U1L6H1_ARTAN|nr:importin-5 [Artemisia annua]
MKESDTLPKFGDWDLKNPSSATEFSIIFDKARQARKARYDHRDGNAHYKDDESVMIENLKQLVTMVLDSIHDPYPCVRWAAIHAIALFSIYLGPHLQLQYHARVLPAIASAMDDFENPRVQAHAAIAMIKFSQDCTLDILTPYLDGMVSKLVVLLQSGTQMVQERALIALESVVHKSSEEQFQKYYDELMPCLKAILVNETLECIHSVGIAVGKDKFREDFKQVAEVLLSLEGALRDTAAFTSYLRAWGRLRKCLGQDFLPYMAVGMPALLASAQPEHASSIEEIATACKVLCCIADDLKEDFFPWIEQVAPILVPLLKFNSLKVRKAAVPAMPRLLRYSKLAIEKGRDGTCLKQLSDYIVPALVNALHKVMISGPLLDEIQVRSIMDEIKHVIIASSRMLEERAERIKALDFNALPLKEENEKEKEVFDQVDAVLKTLVKTFDSSFLPFFDELSSYLMPLLGKDKTAKERRIAIRIFVLVAKQCREAALRFYDAYLPFLFEACNDENSDVRQAAAYGLGVCAEYVGSAIKPLIGEALSSLNAVIRHPDALHPDNVMAYDNAVSALGKICHFHRDSIDSAQVIPAWLNCLPIKGDVAEAKAVHELLSVMVERYFKELMC